jgi:hypothetical protein
MARARLEQAASAMGLALTTAAPGGLAEALRRKPPEVVVLDLDGGGEALLAEVERARTGGIEPPRVVGYFSHVDESLGAAARKAGCEALPRGRFWRTLPEVIAPAP